ncbi:MAG: NADH-quinone oxidoreductase subunit J [Candidatus Poseidoniales archaeon]|jgi:NADH:ubiquinone oxidoreductase subunit 6 (subunit J)
MRSLSAFTRFGLLVMGFALISIVSAPDVWSNASEEEVTTSQLADGMFGDWGLALLVLGILMAMAMIGAAYLVRDERIENLEWESKGGDGE